MKPSDYKKYNNLCSKIIRDGEKALDEIDYGLEMIRLMRRGLRRSLERAKKLEARIIRESQRP